MEPIRICKKCGKNSAESGIENFAKNGRHGRINICKECYRENIRRKRYNLPLLPDTYSPIRKKHIHSNPRKKLSIPDMLQKFKMAGCKICGYNEHLCCIHIHHIDPDTKNPKLKQKTGAKRYMYREDWEKELKKCVPLCAMCHCKLHAGIISL